MNLPEAILKEKLINFLREDIGLGDITTDALISKGTKAKGKIIAKERKGLLLAGISEVKLFFSMLNLKTEGIFKNGDWVKFKDIILTVYGEAGSMLMAERTALNLLMRMSGIATLTRHFSEKIKKLGVKTKISATRKVAPGLIYFDKKAVKIGGGDTHRLHLEDAILIKDNHIALVGNLEKAINLAKGASFTKKIEIEVKNKEQAIKAALLGVDIIMLDNFSPTEVKETIDILKEKELRKKVIVEVSGSITQENLVEYARFEPDIISLGQLTHSAKAVDISLHMEPNL
jgi:nicotinate-nucleotide pyrophosphorylase (carboxylating)